MKRRAAIHLRAPASSSLTVDVARGIIAGAAVLSAGPALGHGFDVDDVMLRQAHRHLLGGARVRLGHPADDDIFVRVGTLRNPRMDGNVLRADVHLGDYAKSTPKGNLYAYITALAAEAPGDFGLSLVFQPGDFERSNGRTLGRIAAIMAVDFVGDPAANPNGLLSAPRAKETTMPLPKELRQSLADRNLVSLQASDEEALAWIKGAIDSAQGLGGDGADGDGSGGGDGGAMSAGVKAGVALERKRQQHIRGIARQLSLGEAWVQQQIAGGFEIATVNENAIKTLEQRTMGGRFNPGDLHMTREPHDGAREGLVQAISMSRGVKIEKPSERVREFQHLRPLEQIRRYFGCLGIDTTGVSRATIARAACSRREFEKLSGGVIGHSTSDYPAILADSLGKSLRAAYQQRPASWRGWAQQRLVPDFKEQSRVSLSDFPVPQEVKEGAEIKTATIGEAKEVFTLATFARMFTITWQALVNDDLSAFDGVEQRMVLAAIGLEDTLAYQPLTSNQVMTEDGLALFHTTHANIISGTPAGPPTVAQLSAMRSKMAQQTGPGGNILALRPSALIVPTELSTVAEQLVASLVDPSKSNDTTNPAWIRNLSVVDEARLDLDSVSKWYLTTRDIDNLIVAFLEDEPSPVVESDESFETLGLRVRIRHSCAARAIDFRAFCRNG